MKNSMYMKQNKIILFIVTTITLTSCIGSNKNVVNVYSTRHYTVDGEIFDAFTKQTGIKVNIIKSDPEALLTRLEQEKKAPQADVFFTADYPRLYRAKEKGLLEAIKTDTLLKQTSPKYRDKDNFWYGMSLRLRIIAIDTNWTGARPSTYADLTNEIYKGKILVRSGGNAYNISLIASLLAQWGETRTKEFLKRFVANFARTPEGNDRKQVADIYAKKGSLAIINTYYMGLMYTSVDPEVQNAAKSVDLIYPQDTHFNISGFVVIKNAKNKVNAIKLLEFVTSEYAQKKITLENYEYPVNPNVAPTDIFLKWKDSPKMDNVELDTWGSYYERAAILIDEAAWK